MPGDIGNESRHTRWSVAILWCFIIVGCASTAARDEEAATPAQRAPLNTIFSPTGTRQTAEPCVVAQDTRPPRSVVTFIGSGRFVLSDGTVVDSREGTTWGIPGVPFIASPRGIVIEQSGGVWLLGKDNKRERLPFFELNVALSASEGHGCIFGAETGVWCPHGPGDCADRTYSESYRPPERERFPFRELWCKLDVNVQDVHSLAGQDALGCLVEGGTKKLYCWRAGDRVREVRIGTSPIKQVAASSEHMCVLNEDGEVACWGDGSFGELGYVAQKVSDYAFELQTGNPRFVQLTPPPRFLDLPAPAEQIFAAERISCAWLVNGQLWCWGDLGPMAFDGMDPATNAVDRMSLGYNSRRLPIYKPRWSSTLPTHPVKMPSDCQPEHIAVFFKTICIACDTGCAQCWGYNDHNALGYGDSNERGEPTNECYSF